jgi:hypothetical protein
VPLGKALFSEHNPVRSGGPMQVSIGFAQTQAASTRYPFAVQGSIRDEVFTRRGGLYFGIAHLFDYAAPYDDLRYRFADYNAGRYASRNAAFQKAVSELTGIALELDGDVLRFEQGKPVREVSRTEAAVRTLAGHFEMTNADVRGDLELGQSAEFERSRPLSFGLHHGRRRGRPAHPARGRADDRGRELQDAAPPDELRLRHARRRTPQGLPRATVVSPKPAVRCRIIAGR